MKIKTTRDEITELLREPYVVAKDAGKIALQPAYSFIRLAATNNSISATATDSWHVVSATGHLDVDEAGEMIVHHSIYDLLRSMPYDSITIEQDDSQVVVRSIGEQGQETTYRYETLPPSEYPETEPMQIDTAAVVDGHDLSVALQRVRHAADKGDRPNLAGVMLTIDEAGIRTVATDGHRLALCEMSHSLETGARIDGAIIPIYAVELIRKAIAAGKPERVEISQTDSTVYIHTPTVDLHVRTIDATFPPYEQVIPDYGDAMHVSVELLHDALRRIQTYSRKSLQQSVPGVTMSIIGSETAPRGRALRIAPLYGEGAEEIVPINNGYAGALEDLPVNPKILMEICSDVLRHVPEGIERSEMTVAIGVHDQTPDVSPIHITIPEDDTTQYVMMPLKRM